MGQQRLRAVFMRGGTSKAVVLRREDLPDDQEEWGEIFCEAIGSPDPYGRQLDGMGGGVSSLSKVCVVGPSTRPDADVDYTFAQVAIGEAAVDYAANCGNMSSAIGPFAVDEGLVPRPSAPQAVVRIHNTNTAVVIRATFPFDGTAAAVDGDTAIDGVAGTGAPVRLDFLDPGGTKTGRVLPTGRAVDMVEVSGIGPVRTTMIDAGNPCVFAPAEDLGLSGTELPDHIDARPEVLTALEEVRRDASVAMGLTPDPDTAAMLGSIPKVAVVTGPQASRTLSGRVIPADSADLLVRMMSMGQPHRALPVTGALCLAVAARIPGTVAHSLLDRDRAVGSLRLAHPSGTFDVDAAVTVDDAGVQVESATVLRTARRLFEGNVLYRPMRSGSVTTLGR